METLRELTADENELLTAWRAKALIGMPYMSSILYELRPVSALGLGTFAVDTQWRLYIDFDAVIAWGVDTCADALLHEASHLFAGHAKLAQAAGIEKENHHVWNVAGDMAINDDLRDSGCESFADDGDFMLPAKIGAQDYQTPHHYFSLLKRMQQHQPSNGGGTDATGGSGQGEHSNETGGQAPFAGCGSGAGSQPVPDELDEEGLSESTAGASESTQEIARIRTASDIREHVANKGRGSIGEGLVTTAELTFTPTKTPWPKLLSRAVRASIMKASGTRTETYNRRNARRHNERIIGSGARVVHPAHVDFQPRIVTVRDTSASMGRDDLELASSEIMSIARKMRGEVITIDTDAMAGTARTYRRGTDLNTIAGGGGTDMRVGIAAALEHSPDVVVVLTDGGTPWPEQPLKRARLIVVLTSDCGMDTPDWATTIHAYE